MQYNLLECFSELEDARRLQGQRYTLPALLSMIVMAILSNHQGIKGFARFAKNNEQELIDIFGLKHGVPCYFTFRSLLMGLKAEKLSASFITWMKPHFSGDSEQFVALDGKGLNPTVSNANNELQDFVSIVSAFGHKSGLTLGANSFHNAKSGECEALRQLVQKLGLKDVTFTMDALHTKKNFRHNN